MIDESDDSDHDNISKYKESSVHQYDKTNNNKIKIRKRNPPTDIQKKIID